VGDSRVYFFREGTLRQITEDHSLLNDYLKAKKLTPEEIEAFPHKNVIVRALGMKDTVTVDINRVEPKDGDIYLLCSDGLSGMLTDEQILDIMSGTEEPGEICRRLVSKANDHGGEDNITALVVRFDDGATTAATTSSDTGAPTLAPPAPDSGRRDSRPKN
jgi:protein phosphatase